MPDLDAKGLEAAAKALSEKLHWLADDDRASELAGSAIRAYLAAVPVQMPGAAGTCPECSTPLDPLPPIAVVPVTPTTENPYRGRAHRVNRRAWDEGFAAGRAAATPELRNGCRAPHCFSEYGTPCGTCPAEKPETP